MLIVVNHHSGLPVYRQIMDQIRLQIASGMLAAGSELPSTRALSAQLSLNPMTVSKAYGLLERDGVLERRRGQTLTVKAQSEETVQVHKEAQLKESLASAVTVARQLGIPSAKAQRVFREMLDQAER